MPPIRRERDTARPFAHRDARQHGARTGIDYSDHAAPFIGHEQARRAEA
jgi:hypothetical protein